MHPVWEQACEDAGVAWHIPMLTDSASPPSGSAKSTPVEPYVDVSK
eukprot:CAMPEP_0204162284 /NCGR_PEP_ID=MMETSP0361-20130328/35424_1 /ASSEMBLY_ACC=CAM_ASM_000343 /TAXON_ID=268821 /ORGANISM="Scrippsiella Hangoei, Strain SHTV-5" /LENGTH=45 /DNA_ID= /DNA_START= /DNA_END= /DNA_ORIENTATION=